MGSPGCQSAVSWRAASPRSRTGRREERRASQPGSIRLRERWLTVAPASPKPQFKTGPPAVPLREPTALVCG
jgi:hypothetical protein